MRENTILILKRMDVKYKLKPDRIIFLWDFNESLDEYMDLINSRNKIMFENSLIRKTQSLFNQPIKSLPEHLTHIIFGHYFNQPINLPICTQFLMFGDHFNQHLILPNNITFLSFGKDFNQRIILPNKLLHLTFGTSFNMRIILPEKLCVLSITLNSNTMFIIDNLPNSLKKLFLYTISNTRIFNNLPNSIEVFKITNDEECT